MTNNDSLSSRLASVARDLQVETGADNTMDLAVKLAVDVIGGAEEAAISLVQRDRIVSTPASTGELAAAVDQLQLDLAQGPLVSDVWDHEYVSVPDLGSDSRWGDWGPRAARETGVASMLCFPLYTRADRVGALSVYSGRRDAFTSADVETGISFAAHAAIAIGVAQHDEHLDLALDSRSLIGQATGIVMERYQIDAVRAYAVLKRLSQHSNVKLHEVAAELIRTRHLPS